MAGGLKQTRQQRRFMFTSTWGTTRKLGLIGVFISAIIMTIFLQMPVGFTAFCVLWSLKSLWRSFMDDGDPTLGSMIPGTFEYKVAEFFDSVKSKWSQSATPLVALGFGPPEDDQFTNVEQGWRPPFRLSSYWAILAVLPLLIFDWITHFVAFPIWGFKLPTWLVMIMSFIGWFATVQISADASRNRAIMEHGSPYPATMINHVKVDSRFWHAVTDAAWRSAIVPAIIAVTILGINQLVHISGIWQLWLFVFAVFISFFSTLLTNRISEIYCEPWEEHNGNRDEWDGVFIDMREKVPMFIGESDLPGEDVWMERVQDDMDMMDDDELEEYDPGEYMPATFAATFQMSPGTTFGNDFAGKNEMLLGKFGDDITAAFTPVPMRDSAGQFIQGSESAEMFRVMWTEEPLDATSVYDPNLQPELVEIAIRAFVIDPISKVKAIGRVKYHSRTMMTRPKSNARIARITVLPAGDISFEAMMKSVNAVRDATGAPWCRIGQGVDPDTGKTVYDIFLGDDPTVDPDNVKWSISANRKKNDITAAVWNYALFANKVFGDGGTPKILDIQPIRRPPTADERKKGKKQGNKVGDVIVFDQPAGLPLAAVRKAEDAIKTSSGNEFLEIVSGINESSPLKDATRQELNSKAQMSFITGERHPLRELYRFRDFKPEIISGREPGVAKVDTVAGVLADGTFAVDSFNGAEPHLVVAGSSGSGKSAHKTTQMLVIKASSNS